MKILNEYYLIPTINISTLQSIKKKIVYLYFLDYRFELIWIDYADRRTINRNGEI